jgi:non-specific serine/threonine protein kinase
MIGRTLSHYEITAKLGEGGMGEVYRATDKRLGREVAIKVLPGDSASDPGWLARFEREARTVAGLNHPNIVVLHSIEDENGIRFITMELVEGQSLDRHVEPGGQPIGCVVELGVALADALAAAHEKGVVHRDLKPANVMLTLEGRVKVLDFGLAKLEVPGPGIDEPQAATLAAPLSAPGQVMGTVPYMAPEQVRGEAVDSRTDVFALGIMLYELATGRRPFEGSTSGVISSAILRDAPVPLAQVRADVPADLDRIVSRCLEKEPSARYQTALELSNALRHVRQAREGGAAGKALPATSGPLLGRDESLDAAAERLHGGARVLSVTGYGGTGKTRFSIELFRRLAPEYSGGAVFVSLASVTRAAEVLPTVAVELDIAEAQGRTALEALATVIGDRRVLLVLDNLEQVLDAAGDIAELVSRCPGLQIIATSRAPLKISAESEFALPPLALPASGTLSLEELARSPSVALLLQRGEKVKPGFALTAENAESIVAICRRLDGLPLALELAAARLRILEPAVLVKRLDHSLDLLTSGDRDLPLRQRTLRATISWSYSLLDREEQRLLRHTSVFHEGWTLEAMEHVCYGEDERHRALDELDSLVEKGLVRVVDSGGRYALLETIRAFASEQLHAGGEIDAARDAHADYYLGFVADVAADIFGAGQREAVPRGRRDNANTLAAIHWLTARARDGDTAALEKGLLLSGHLNWPWHMAGQHMTARVLLDTLLALAADGPPSRGRALAWLAAGMISTVTGEWDRSLEEWTAGYDEGRVVGDERIAAEGAMGMGYCHLHGGRMAEARAALDDSITRSADGVCDFIRALSMTLKGMLVATTGELEAGMTLIGQARRIQERLDDCEGGGVALSFLAQMTSTKGDQARALTLYREALASFEAVGDHPEIARVHCETGWAALAAEKTGTAQDSFRRAVHAYEVVGSPRGTGLALLGLAAVEAAEGRSERAVAIAAAAQALSERAGVVVEHPMDPGVVERIEALKASIPKAELEGLVADASSLSPAAVLAMIAE